jgi:hypothetical protein
LRPARHDTTLGLASFELNKETWHSFHGAFVDDPSRTVTTTQMTSPAMKETGNFHFAKALNVHCCNRATQKKSSAMKEIGHSTSLMTLASDLV